MEVLALDRPGFGASGPVGAMTSLAAQAAAVAALLPADGRPGVLLAASLDPAQERIHLLQHIGDCAPVRMLLPRILRNANAELMVLEPEVQALAAMLPLITAKVVIVHGSKDDLVPVASVPFMQARLTGARCVQTVLLKGRNHFLPWNSEDVVRTALRTALEAGC